MGFYRKNLSGERMFKSYVPTPLSDIEISHTAEIDKLIASAEAELKRLNEHVGCLSAEETNKMIADEAESSCYLAAGKQPLSFGFISFMSNDDPVLAEDIQNLEKATRYAVDELADLPLSTRLIKNAHYLMCSGNSYEKKYPGEFRSSPTWIGKTGCGLKDALFVPPVEEDMIPALTDWERYIHYDEREHPLVKAALIHYQFETIHPFIDGNGRAGRLVNTLFLIDNGLLDAPVLPLSKALNRHSDIYYAGLQYIHETEEYERWVQFFLDMTIKAARNI